MPYVHLLELLVTVYVFVAPGALVCKLLWVAPIVSGFFTLFFYGTHARHTCSACSGCWASHSGTATLSSAG